MKLPSFENVGWYALVAGLASVLLLLALLQYRASKQVSDATTEQMRASLQGSLMDVREGLERELTPLCRELQSAEGADHLQDSKEYVNGLERWRSEAAHPGIVSDVFSWQETGDSPVQLLKLNPTRSGFEAAEWSEGLAQLRQRLKEVSRGLLAAGSVAKRQEPPLNQGAGMTVHSGGDLSEKLSRPVHHNRPKSSGDFGSRPEFADSAPLLSWMIDQNIPALVHPVIEPASEPGSEAKGPKVSWVVIVLNLEVFENHIFPELIQRYFGKNEQSTYDLAVSGVGQQPSFLYSSGGSLGRQPYLVADAALNFFGPPDPIVKGGESSDGVFLRRGPGHRSRQANATVSNAAPAGFHDEERFRIDPIHYTEDEQDWEIIARHRKGSLEAGAASLYHHNLLINFGVLLILALTMGMIIAASHGARKLAQLQMDFVASVSHELRTPLTGIVAAAQNIADGVIDDKNKVARYGAAITHQAQQLSDLVEQILLFSATQKDRHRYHLQPVEIPELIAASLKNTGEMIRSAGFVVHQEIQSGLPPVWADFRALSHSLQNLIANSVKYGGESRWLGLRAYLANGLDGSKEVNISVEDKGIGINPEDLKRIFEPFYRSPEVTTSSIHGTGLGLPLAKRIAEAMGGRLTVESVPQQGSIFTIHLPVKNEFEEQPVADLEAV